jgi:hypothetical protein
VTPPSRLAALFFVAAAAACGGRAVDADEERATGGGTNGGGSAQGGSPSSGGTTRGGTNSAGSSSAGTGQGGFACAAYDDQPGYSINVAFINKTSAPIHLGQDTVTCSAAPLFSVNDASGTPLAFPGSCRASCESLRSQGPIGCGAACLFPSAVTLAPGEVLTTTWDGLYEVPQELPGQCLPAGVSGQCRRAVQIEPGSFTFSAQAGTTLDCSQTSGGPCNACVREGNGGCTTPGSLIRGPKHAATTTVRLDERYGVWDAAAPAPLPPGGADVPGGVMATLSVELVFVDPEAFD